MPPEIIDLIMTSLSGTGSAFATCHLFNQLALLGPVFLTHSRIFVFETVQIHAANIRQLAFLIGGSYQTISFFIETVTLVGKKMEDADDFQAILAVDNPDIVYRLLPILLAVMPRVCKLKLMGTGSYRIGGLGPTGWNIFRTQIGNPLHSLTISSMRFHHLTELLDFLGQFPSLKYLSLSLIRWDNLLFPPAQFTELRV